MRGTLARRGTRRNGKIPGPKDQILAAAAELFMDKGYHASSVRDIGDRLRISQSSLYYHARSKEQILVDLNQRFMDRLVVAIEEIAGRSDPPSTKLREVILELISAISRNHAEVTVVLHERRSLPSRQLKQIQKCRDRVDQIVDDIIQAGIDSGEFRATDVRLTRLALTGMCNWAYTWYKAGGRLRPQEIADQFAAILLTGIAKKKG